MKSSNNDISGDHCAANEEVMKSAILVIYPMSDSQEGLENVDTKRVFLNEWCAKEFLFSNKARVNFEIAKPAYISQQQRDSAVESVTFYEEKLFSTIVKILNDYHKTNFTELFWKKLIGHWFKRFIQITLYNLVLLESCFSNYKISEIQALSSLCSVSPFKTTADINILRSDPHWVSDFNLKLLDFIERPEINTRYVHSKFQSVSPLETKSRAWSHKKVLVKYLYKLTKVFSSSNRYFLYSTYLPRKSEIQLNLLLAQIPQRWDSPEICLNGFEDLDLRKEFTSQLKNSESTGLEAALSQMIFEYFPICYLEGWKELRKSVENLDWPKSPKTIFTSNEFDTNEHFKVWSALKCLNGSEYIVGQHGNNYGTNRYMRNTIEEVTSDRFITWGWGKGQGNHFKGINLKTAGLNFRQFPNSSSVLLVGAPFENGVDIWCGNFSQRLYVADLSTFLAKLFPKIRDEIIVRPYQNTGLTNHSELQILSSTLGDVAFDNSKNFYESVKRSKLVIFTYDSTGFLELLSLNIPVIAFWQNEFTHVSEEALPFYEGLLRVGILHHSPESLAHHVNQVWPDILKWWNSSPVQGSRSTFCKEYSATSQSPIKFLSTMIKN